MLYHYIIFAMFRLVTNVILHFIVKAFVNLTRDQPYRLPENDYPVVYPSTKSLTSKMFLVNSFLGVCNLSSITKNKCKEHHENGNKQNKSPVIRLCFSFCHLTILQHLFCYLFAYIGDPMKKSVTCPTSGGTEPEPDSSWGIELNHQKGGYRITSYLTIDS